jgi:hypothetical protein
MRDSPGDLVGVDDLAFGVAVAFGLVLQAGKCGAFFLGPGDEDGAGALDGDAGLRGVVAEQVVAAGDEPGFEGAGGGVEAGVQQGRVGLAGGVAHVVAGFDEGDGQVSAGEVAGDGGTDDACADDGDVEDLRVVAHDVRVPFARVASAARCQRSR